MERALVIGATGYVGRHILRALYHSDIEVEAMRRWNADTAWIDEFGVPTAVADLLDRESLVESLAGFNYVFMVAAPDPEADEEVYLQESVRGMRQLLQVSRDLDIERVIVTSCATTVSAPGPRSLASEEDLYLPGTAGDVTIEAQYAAEQECFREAADGLDVIILNPGICIGEGARVPARGLLDGVSNEAPINLVDVDDVARAHLAAAREQAFGERFLLGGENTTVGAFFERLEPLGDDRMRLGRYEVERVERRSRLRHLSLYERGSWLASDRAEARFGFRPRPL